MATNTKKTIPTAQAVPVVEGPVTADEGVEVFSTVRPCNVLFNILCKGEIIYGRFADKRKAIHFTVPKRLVKDFSKHHHVRTGFIVPLSKLPESLRYR